MSGQGIINSQYEDYIHQVKDRIRAIRESEDLTQLTVAEGMGVSIRTYERLEQVGGIIPSLKTLYLLAQYYDMTLSELINVDEH